MRRLELHKNSVQDLYRITIDGKMFSIGVTRAFAGIATNATRAEIELVYQQFFVWANGDLSNWGDPLLTDQEKDRIRFLIVDAVMRLRRDKTPKTP